MSSYKEILDNLRANHNFRSIPQGGTETGIVDMSGNDYLGLAADIDLKEEFFDSLRGDRPAMSASASRLLASEQSEFQAFEKLLEMLYNAPALLFNSGYHVNSGAIAALAKQNTLIVADKLVHASIIDGMVLSRAPFERFRHNDAEHLDRILAKKAKEYEHVLIVTESVFSMDGDVAPLDRISEAKKQYANAMLYVDEAHAFGVMGRDGLGLAVDIPDVDFIVGTLGKAAASTGAFIICRQPEMRDYLINSARSLIFSTALPPICACWSRFIVERIPGMYKRREKLAWLAKQLGKVLKVENPSHIQPLITGSSASALELSAKLLEYGFKVLPIRTPTVPAGTERLRFSLSANMNPDDIDRLSRVL